MSNYHIDLKSNCIYHIFNRAIGNEKLFRNDENYRYFLQKYLHHVGAVVDTYSWCLLPNHFHIMICVRPESEIISQYKFVKKSENLNPDLLPDFIMERFSNFFNGYAKAFNKQHNRRGSLFIDYMRRVEILDNNQFLATIFYIHKNSVHHGFSKKIIDWKWSSYHTFLSDMPTLLKRETVFDWFGSKAEFIQHHQQPIYLKEAVIIE